MKFLAVSHNAGDPTPLLQDEAHRTAQLQRDGVFDSVFLKADWPGAVIMVSAHDLDGARAAVDSLPLVANGITRFDLTALVEPPA